MKRPEVQLTNYSSGEFQNRCLAVQIFQMLKSMQSLNNGNVFFVGKPSRKQCLCGSRLKTMTEKQILNNILAEESSNPNGVANRDGDLYVAEGK